MSLYTLEYGSVSCHELTTLQTKKKKTETLKYWDTVHIFPLNSSECFWLQETKFLTEADLNNEEIYYLTKQRPQVRVSGFAEVAARRCHQGPNFALLFSVPASSSSS